MIVKMKKAFLVVMDSHREEALNKLKKIGLLHINRGRVSSDVLQSLEEQRGRIERCLMILPPYEDGDAPGYSSMEDSLEKANEILEGAENIRRREEELERIKRDYERLEVWGDFLPSDMVLLREKGIPLRLFAVSPDKADAFQNIPVFSIKKTKTVQYIAAIADEAGIPEGIAEVPLPEKGIAELRAEMETRRAELEAERAKLASHASLRPCLETALLHSEDSIQFENVLTSFSQEESLSYLTGFIPEKKINEMKRGAEKNGWALLVTEPDDDDQVPTLVENNRFIRIIEPIFNLLGTTPGYHEYDISGWFLLFFSFFFAVIIGDAGYGTIFLILSLIIRIKSGKSSDLIRLLMVLSITTIAWGAITGTWFASEAVASLPPLKMLVIEPISSLNPDSGQMIRLICFIVGTVHIALAHLQNFLKKLPSLNAFGDLSWLIMVLGLYYVVLNLVLDATKYPIPSYALYMVIGGLIGVFLFDKQEKGTGFIKGVLRGLTDFLPTFLSSISAFSDIISYIRLYAVGLAGVAIASSFNNMAAGLGSGVVAIIAGAFIAVFGHSLNIAMGALSVIVHGVRLNMLEYAGHRGIEWTGIKYEPFRENIKLKEKEI